MPSAPPGWISDRARAVARHPVLDSLDRYEVEDANTNHSYALRRGAGLDVLMPLKGGVMRCRPTLR